MAFGDFATLRDDFNRSNANPLDGSWTNRILSSNGDVQLAGNVVTGATSAICTAWYTGFTPGADCEAYITLVNIVTGANMGLYARLKDMGAAADGYFFQITPGSPDTTTLFRLDNGSATSIGSTTSVDWVNGDKAGIQCIGSSISAWRFDGSSWTQVVSATDANYGLAGPFGIRCNSFLQSMDDFYAGTVVAAASTFSPKVMVF